LTLDLTGKVNKTTWILADPPRLKPAPLSSDGQPRPRAEQSSQSVRKTRREPLRPEHRRNGSRTARRLACHHNLRYRWNYCERDSTEGDQDQQRAQEVPSFSRRHLKLEAEHEDREVSHRHQGEMNPHDHQPPMREEAFDQSEH
jgi:hypothetical protein